MQNFKLIFVLLISVLATDQAFADRLATRTAGGSYLFSQGGHTFRINCDYWGSLYGTAPRNGSGGAIAAGGKCLVVSHTGPAGGYAYSGIGKTQVTCDGGSSPNADMVGSADLSARGYNACAPGPYSNISGRFNFGIRLVTGVTATTRYFGAVEIRP